MTCKDWLRLKKRGEINLEELFDRYDSAYLLEDVFSAGAPSIMAFLLGAKDDIGINFSRRTEYFPGVLHNIIRYHGWVEAGWNGGKYLQALKILLSYIPSEQFKAIVEYEEEWEDDDGEFHTEFVDYDISELLSQCAGKDIITVIKEEIQRRGLDV